MNDILFLRQPTLTLGLIGLTLLLVLGFHTAAHAQSYNEQTLYSFGSTAGDGAGPRSVLTNVNGILYGTTNNGGTNTVGSIFSFDPNTKTQKTLYSFIRSNSDGSNPLGGLTYDSATGKLYGTTEYGGSGSYGTLFSFDPSTRAETLLYSFGVHFNTPSDGYYPAASMIDVNGTLYGTTFNGGGSGYGAVFSFDATTHVYRTLHSFDRADASGPEADLTYDSTSGKLYGTTTYYAGGMTGTLFSLSLDGTGYQTLHTFGFTSGDGYLPLAGLIKVNSIFYGTTLRGGAYGHGTLYSYDPATNIETPLYSFTTPDSNGQNPDGFSPQADLVYDMSAGKLFGTASYGGPSGDGTVFTFDPSTNIFNVIYAFQGTEYQANPYAGLLDINGTFFGTTIEGGSQTQGSIFSLTQSNANVPTANNDHGTGYYNTALAIAEPGVLGNDTNGNSGPVIAALVTHPTHGSVTLNSDGSFRYSPNTGYVGTDSFTYQDSNPIGKSNVATCTLTIQATAPVAVNNSNIVKYQTPLSVASPGVLGNDSNGGSSPMTADLVTTVSHGMLTLNSNGAFIYTPAAGFLGTDSFTYQTVNSVGKSNVATATLIVQATEPTANNDHGTGYYNTVLTIGAPGVLGNDSNGGKGPLTAAIVTNPTRGTLTFNSDGSFQYTPTKGFVGTDSFTYKDTNPIGPSNTATVTLTINPKAPTAVNNSNMVKKNTTLTVSAPGVLGNDDNGGSSPMTAQLVTTVSHGTLTLTSNGSFTYTPNTGFTGTDSFTYQAVNSVGKSNIATATLTVQ